MEHTCPSCRHVVPLGAGGTGRCPNCGEIVVAPAAQRAGAPSAAPGPADAPPVQPPGREARPVPAPPRLTLPPERPVRAVSIVALVCGLLFFLPFVPQALAVVFGLVAILRRRLPRERLAGAWVGLVLGCVAMAGWLVTCAWTRSTAFTATFAGFGYLSGPRGAVEDEAEAAKAEEWATRMERAARAVNDHRRDFRKWPASLEEMGGTLLPADFKLPPALRYHAPPEGHAPPDWVLLSSDPVLYDRVHEKLDSPHRLTIGIDEKLKCLPAEDVQAALDAQAQAQATPAHDPPP